LKNICKINTEDKFYEEDEEEDVVFYSSKSRGTAIHLVLSKLFKNIISIENVAPDLQEIAKWVLLQSESIRDYQCVSEELIKFDFFGNMISGTPDLYFISNDKHLIIWDFKTGQRNPSHERGYWFQLMSYAYGIGKNFQVGKDVVVEMNLIYIDEKLNISKKLNLSDISLELFQIWKKTEELYRVNLSHCSVCEYSSICKKTQA
jgi:hypothetical protein